MATIWGSANVAPNAAYRFPVDVSAVGTPSHVVISDLVTFVQESGYGVNSLGNLTGTKTIEFENGLYAKGTVTGNVTVSFSTIPIGASVLTLELTNGGAFIITWPGAVSWTSGTAPTLRTSGKDIIRFYSFDDGASFLGELAYDEQSFQAAIQWQEEGSNLGAAGTVDTINFVGTGFTASRSTNTVTLTLATASTSAVGVIEIATTAEHQAITDTGRAATPGGIGDVIRYTATRTADWTLAEADMGSEQIVDSGSARVCTIALNATAAITTGSAVAVTRIGAGSVTIDAVSGVTLNGVNGGSCTISDQWQSVVLRKTATDTWYITGSRSAVA